jgi:hypothetical protein
MNLSKLVDLVVLVVVELAIQDQVELAIFQQHLLLKEIVVVVVLLLALGLIVVGEAVVQVLLVEMHLDRQVLVQVMVVLGEMVLLQPFLEFLLLMQVAVVADVVQILLQMLEDQVAQVAVEMVLMEHPHQ